MENAMQLKHIHVGPPHDLCCTMLPLKRGWFARVGSIHSTPLHLNSAGQFNFPLVSNVIVCEYNWNNSNKNGKRHNTINAFL